MSNDLQSAVERLKTLAKSADELAASEVAATRAHMQQRAADLRFVLDALAEAQTEIESLEFELKNVQARFDETS